MVVLILTTRNSRFLFNSHLPNIGYDIYCDHSLYFYVHYLNLPSLCNRYYYIQNEIKIFELLNDFLIILQLVLVKPELNLRYLGFMLFPQPKLSYSPGKL